MGIRAVGFSANLRAWVYAISCLGFSGFMTYELLSKLLESLLINPILLPKIITTVRASMEFRL